MADELENYIKRKRSSGASKKDVEGELLKSGWAPEHYSRLLDRHFASEKPKAIPKSPSSKLQAVQMTPRQPASPSGLSAYQSRQVSAPRTSDLQQKIEPPAHEYVRLPAVPWPLRKIMEKESETTYSRIHPISLWAGAITFVLFLGIYLSCLWLLAAFADKLGVNGPLAFAAGAFLALPIFLSWAISLRYVLDTYCFSLQDEFIFVRSGTINPVYHMIPYENVQDAQVTQDVLDRILGIAKVVVSTPASSVFTPSIPLQMAQKFREDLLSLAKMHKGMAE